MKNNNLEVSIIEKRRFLTYGIINFMITNISLQIMLLSMKTYQATLFSQLINIILGYFIYGKRVFKVKRFSKRSGFKYSFLALVLWLINLKSITYLFELGINKNLAAMFIIPSLVTMSFIGQKYFVFRKLI